MLLFNTFKITYIEEYLLAALLPQLHATAEGLLTLPTTRVLGQHQRPRCKPYLCTSGRQAGIGCTERFALCSRLKDVMNIKQILCIKRLCQHLRKQRSAGSWNSC